MQRFPVIALVVLSLAACSKSDETSSAKPSESAAPAAPAPTALAPLGLQIDAPAGAPVVDSSADAPAADVNADGCTINVATATDVYASDFEAAKKEIRKDPNPFKRFTREDQREGGWHLEYELEAMGEKVPLYGVRVRTTIGDKQFECGRNSRSAAERDCVAKACLTLRK